MSTSSVEIKAHHGTFMPGLMSVCVNSYCVQTTHLQNNPSWSIFLRNESQSGESSQHCNAIVTERNFFLFSFFFFFFLS